MLAAPMMDLSNGYHIKDESTSALVIELAARRGLSPEEAVNLAVERKLDRFVAPVSSKAISFKERLAAFHAVHPLPSPTGLKADKAFFDELSGEPV